MAGSLAELRKLSQHQLNSIREEDLVQSILSTQESEDRNDIVMTQLTALTAEVANFKKALTSDSNINKQMRDLQELVIKQQQIITK